MHEDIVSFINGECIKMSTQQLEEAPNTRRRRTLSSFCPDATELFDFLQLADLERVRTFENTNYEEIINAESRQTCIVASSFS